MSEIAVMILWLGIVIMAMSYLLRSVLYAICDEIERHNDREEHK